MQSKKDRILTKIKEIIVGVYPTAKIYLYGSRAKKAARNGSDWDVLILLDEDKITYDIERKVTSPLYDLEFESGEVISPMIYSEKEWFEKFKKTPFYKNVMNEGQLI